MISTSYEIKKLAQVLLLYYSVLNEETRSEKMKNILKAHVIVHIARDLKKADFGVVESHNCIVRKSISSISGFPVYWIDGNSYNNELKAATMVLRKSLK
jgi:hypothetical protein